MKSIFRLLIFLLISFQLYKCTDYKEIDLKVDFESKKVNYFLIGSKKQPYFFSLNTVSSIDEFPTGFTYEDGYNLGINDSIFPFNIKQEDPFTRQYLTTKPVEIPSGQNILIYDHDNNIGSCMMPEKLEYNIKQYSIIDLTNKSELDAETFIEYEILNFSEIKHGVSVSVNTTAMWKKDIIGFSNGAYQGELRDSNYISSDLAYLPGTVVNTIIKPEKLKLMKGKFRIRVSTNFPEELIDKPILVTYVSNIDENIRNYAENSVKNGYSAQSSYIPFTFLTFNNLKDRYGFVGCYNVAIDTIEIK